MILRHILFPLRESVRLASFLSQTISNREVILTKLFSPTYLPFLQAMVSGKVDKVLMICQDPEPTHTLKLHTPLVNTFDNYK
jgi:hypothetical protein